MDELFCWLKEKQSKRFFLIERKTMNKLLCWLKETSMQETTILSSLFV
jgi:hypothetical protein